MSNRLRLLLFLTFLLMFLIAAPLLVLYTAGYRFDLGSGHIVHTAVLNISSIPRNATVYIDGQAETDRTPAIIETVLPGEHEIQLQKKGYITWTQNLFFESREATFATDTILFLDENPEPIQELTPIQSAISPTGDLLVYLTQESSWLELWSTTGFEDSTRLLMRLPHDASSEYSISFSLNGDYILLAREEGSFSELTIADTQNGDLVSLPIPLSDTLAYWWDTQRDDLLYVAFTDTSYQIDLTASTETLLMDDMERMTTFDDRDVLLTEHNSRAVLSFLEDDTASIITYLPLGTYFFVPAPAPLIGLFDAQHERLVLIDSENRDQPILLNEAAAQWQWNENDQQLLYSSGFDLRLYDRYQHESDTLTRLSDPIEYLTWYPQGSVVLYQAAGTTHALAVQDPQPEHLVLIEEAPGLFWFVDDAQSLLLLSEEGTIWQRPLQK